MSLRLKLLIPGVGAWLVFFLVLNFYWQPNYLADQRMRFANSLQQQAHLLEKGLVEYLLQGNLASVYAILNEVVEANPEWKQIIVKGINGKQLYPLTELAGIGEASWVTAESEIYHLEEKLATLVVVADPQMMLNEQAAYIRQLNVILLVLLAIAVFISTNLQAVILRNPLRQLAAAAKRIATGEFDVVLPSPSGDELGQLAFSFRTMSNSLKLALEELRDESEMARSSAVALRKSEERFSLAIRGSKDGIWDWELESAKVFFSPRWKKMLGYGSNDIDNNFSAWRDLIHPDDLGRFLVLWTEYMAGQSEIFFIEYRIRRKTGDYAWVLCRGLLSRDEAGHPVRLSGSQTDITERQHADAKLRLQAAALEAAVDSIVITDWDGNIQWVNPAYTRVTGYELDDVLGKNPRIMKSGKQDPAFYKRLWDTIRAGKTWHGELWNKRKDGSLYPEEESITPVLDEQGGISHFVAIKRDISERRQVEEERAQIQKQLRQAQKMEAVGQLTGGIAHDFNNMLTAIMGYTELALERCAEEGNGNGKLTRYLQQVDHAGKQARDLIEQMMVFSRGGAVEPEPMRLQPLVKESLKMLGATLPSSIELGINVQDNLPQVMMDPVQLHQIVMNLCINAKDAMEGKGHIDICLHTVRKLEVVCDSCHAFMKGDFVELAVIDTGNGIDKEILARVFDPFFTTKEIGRGTGMGLAMVHGIVHELGGHIRVKTAPGKGTTFRLMFPVYTGEAGAVEGKRAEAIPSPVKGNGGHILVVDDEVSVAHFLGELFASRDYQVTVETDSQVALQSFKKDPQGFDLVMMDQTMPKLTGAELAQTMLKLRPELPVILCTGYSEQIDEEQARALGIRGFLTKPMEAHVLMGLVRKLLGDDADNPPLETARG